MPDDFDKLIPDLLDVARRIYQVGKEAGIKAERERVLAIVQLVDEPTQQSQPLASRPIKATRRGRSTRPVSYGEISRPVLQAMRELAVERPEGVGPPEIVEYFWRRGDNINELQVRASMKHLFVTGRTFRAHRGRYLPRETAESPLSEEIPDADTSGPLSLAAAE